jgi:hypothetical protein
MSTRDELIRLYAAYPVSQIVSVAEFQRFARKNENDTTFRRERHTVETAKINLEAAIANAGSYAEEIRAVLSVLNRCRLDGKIMEAACYDLAVTAYKPHWSAAQQLYFEEGYKEIQREHDFFLSFTSRHLNEGGENPVNTDYKHFIQQVIPGKWEVADRKKANLLAEAVRVLLVPALPRDFFYPHIVGDNRPLAAHLQAHCSASRVFVQMVQNIMFLQPPPPDQNWCFFEYQHMKTSDPGRVVLVIAEDALLPDSSVPLDYGQWYKEAQDRNVVYLPPVRKWNGRRVEDLRRLITERLRPQLLRVRDQILERVPIR